MDRPQHSDLVRALQDLSWSDVKQMAIHLDKLDLPLLTNIEERPVEERVMYTMKAWLDRDREASWAKVVSALRVIGKDVLAKKIDEERLITVPGPVTLHGQTETGPHVVSPLELQPSPGPDSLHQLQPENEATVISTQEPAFDHSASVSEDTVERETSDYPAVTQLEQNSEISEWRIRNVIVILYSITSAALAVAGFGDYAIPTCTGLLVAMVAFGVKLFIVKGVKEVAVFAAGAAVVVAVLVAAGTARNTTTPTSATAPIATAIASVMEAYRSVIPLAVEGIMAALVAATIALFTTEAVLPVLVAVAVAGAVSIVAGAGVMVAAAVVVVTAAIMAVAGAGAAAAALAAAVVAVAAVAVAHGVLPVLRTVVVGLAAAVVVVGSSPAVRLVAVVVAVMTPVAWPVAPVIAAATLLGATAAVALGAEAAVAAGGGARLGAAIAVAIATGGAAGLGAIVARFETTAVAAAATAAVALLVAFKLL